MVTKNNIIPVDFSTNFTENYLEYGRYIIQDRGIPDVRDGLKPVQRRIIYVFYENKLTSKAKTSKSGKIVGDVMGKYHPHGDSSIYEALVNLTHDWSIPIPPVKGKGNFGDIKGLSAAASRYTESKLSIYGDIFVEDLKPGIVAYKENYDGTLKEPETLPVKVPYLLIAGTSGIVTGMSTSIPTHNPVDVIKTTIAYINNPKITTKELLSILKGPDFPTKGSILNADELLSMYETGIGLLKIKGHVKKEGNNLVIDEIPFTFSGNSDKLLKNIAEAILNKKLPGAIQVQDYTNKNGIEIVISAKKGTDLNKLEQALIAKTKFQDSMSFQFIAKYQNKPQILSLKDYLDTFVDYQNTLIINDFKLTKSKAEKRLEIVTGLLEALPNIDAIIDVVRHAKNTTVMKNALTKGTTENIDFSLKKHIKIVEGFHFSDNQAENILSTPLRRLSKMDADALIKEDKDLNATIKKAEGYINSPRRRKTLLLKQLSFYEQKFRDFKRQTKLLSHQDLTYVEEKIISESTLTIDRLGYVRLVEEEKPDIPMLIFKNKIKSNDQFGIFTTLGNFYKIKADALPLMKPKDKGNALAALTGMSMNEHPLLQEDGDVTLFSQLKDRKILQVTTDGLAKVVQGDAFISTRTKTSATKLKDGELIYSKILNPTTKYILFVSENGLVKKVSIDELKSYGKTSAGAQTSKPQVGDKLIKVRQLKDNNGEIEIQGKNVPLSNIRAGKSSHTMKKVE